MLRFAARVWRQLFPIQRWRCEKCGQVWEQRSEPGYWPLVVGPPGSYYRRHSRRVVTPLLPCGWSADYTVGCGPIVWVARKVA